MDVTLTVEEITPQAAHAMLENNINNRPPSRTRIETYARDMKSRRWKMTGDPIKFNGSKLLDGQHRLLACVIADTPFTTAVARGVSESAHSVIDVGYGRTLAHELKWMGEKEYAALAATINLLWLYEDGSTGTRVASRNDLLSYLRKNGEIRESLLATKGTEKKAPGVHRTSLAAVHFLVGQEHGYEMADAYVNELLSGVGYEEGDPCLTLRNYASSVASARLMRLNSVDWLAVQIKAANGWIVGRPVKQLRWRRVGAKKESFPQIVTKEDLSEA